MVFTDRNLNRFDQFSKNLVHDLLPNTPTAHPSLPTQMQLPLLLISLFLSFTFAAPPCINTDASKLNPIECQCGPQLCSSQTGLLCYSTNSQQGSCRPNNPAPVGFPRPIKKGRCTDVSGRHQIADTTTCGSAAVALGLPVTKAFSNSDFSRPLGCYVLAVGSQNLYLNTYLGSRTPGSRTGECTVEMQCLCIDVPRCSNSIGTFSNEKECLCGDSSQSNLCTQKTGYFCTNTSLCSHYEACRITDGSTPNGKLNISKRSKQL